MIKQLAVRGKEVLLLTLITILAIFSLGLPPVSQHIPKSILRIGFTGITYATTPDYTVDGVDDEDQIQIAMNALPATGGKLILYGGNYSFSDNVNRAISNVTIEGSGKSTSITTVGTKPPFDCTGRTGWLLKDFACDETPAGTFGSSNFRTMLWINSVLTDDLLDSKFDLSGDTLTGPVTLSGPGLVYLRFRPVLDQATIAGGGKPVVAYRGLVKGFILPIYAANQELFYQEPYCPARWDGASDIIVRISGYLADANDNTTFRLETSWESITPNTDNVGTATHDVYIETVTSSWAAYHEFYLEFTLDYDITPADPVVKGDLIALRLRHVTKTLPQNEISGNLVITGVTMRYRCDKFGSST